MSEIARDVTELVGETPLVRLSRLEEEVAQPVALLAKLEWLNPGGSDKDRVALALLNAAEADGVVTKETTIVEPTSGNTGVSLAMVCALRGYRLILVMPDVVPMERIRLLRYLGAEVVTTPGILGMGGTIEQARAILKKTSRSWSPRQFENPATAEAHRATGEEIWRQTGGNVDVLVAGVGTGGIVTGAGRLLKARKPTIRVVAVEPAASPILSGGQPGRHRLYGLGAPFIPTVYDETVVDDVVAVTDEDAYAMMRRLMAREGLLAGPSSGAVIAAALQLARADPNPGRTFVSVLPDSIERHFAAAALDDK